MANDAHYGTDFLHPEIQKVLVQDNIVLGGRTLQAVADALAPNDEMKFSFETENSGTVVFTVISRKNKLYPKQIGNMEAIVGRLKLDAQKSEIQRRLITETRRIRWITKAEYIPPDSRFPSLHY